MPRLEELLLRSAEGDEEDVRPGSGDPLHDRLLLGRGEEAVLRARDPDRRMAALDLGPRAGENSRLAAEQVDGVAAFGGVCEEKLHEVGAVHPARDRVAERARGPDDGHAVGGDEVAELDGLAQLAVGLHAHELGRVQRGVQGRSSRRNGLVHQR